MSNLQGFFFFLLIFSLTLVKHTFWSEFVCFFFKFPWLSLSVSFPWNFLSQELKGCWDLDLFVSKFCLGKMYCNCLFSVSFLMEYFPNEVKLQSEFFSLALEPQDSLIPVYLGLPFCEVLCIFLHWMRFNRGFLRFSSCNCQREYYKFKCFDIFE